MIYVDDVIRKGLGYHQLNQVTPSADDYLYYIDAVDMAGNQKKQIGKTPVPVLHHI